jgi:two-component system, OmpR family, sensor histidine kinase KdpD
MTDQFRPDPDSLLRAIQRDEDLRRGGKLRVFFGMAAGVGKTFRMLQAAQIRLGEGVDVVIGTVDTHGRKETEALVAGIPFIPRKRVEYKGTFLEEMDLDTILKRKPELVVVDELAHANIPGSRHNKRYQDVLELLDNDIDVYTSINVQHLESRKEAVEQITGITIRETVPDSILERATQIELIDLTPGELLKRLKEGKVYLGERAEAAQKNFFKEGPLTALREIALRITAERVDQELQSFMEATQVQGPWKATERLMVAVSHSPYSERLIRATRRIAYNLEAPWIAVNINTGMQLSDEDQAQLMKNLALVRELGGELVTTTETDVPAALQRVALHKNVTQIVVGRPSRRMFKDIIEGGSLLDRLVRESGDFDVHVIRQESKGVRRIPFWTRLSFHSKVSNYWTVFLIVLAVSGLSAFVTPFVGYKAVGFIFLLAVLGVSLVFSMGPILFAAGSSVLLWDFFFIPPRMTFNISEKEDFIMCAMYFVAAITTGMLTNRIRSSERLLRERDERMTLLYEIVSDIVKAAGRTEFVISISARVGKILNGKCTVLLRNHSGVLEAVDPNSQLVITSEKELAVATWAYQSNKRAGWSTDTLSEAEALYVPLKGKDRPIGVLVYKPNARKKLGIDRENLLSTVAKQLAISIERELFEESAREGQRFQDSEKLHQTLLNSVSHELRTPLTSIIGNATAVAEKIGPNDENHIREIAQEIVDSSERLNRVVENILDMTRLNSGVLSLKKEWHDVDDLVGVTLKKLGRHLDNHKVVTEIDKKLQLLEIDFRLMEHMLTNLVFNSSAYTPKGTEIRVGALSRDGLLRLTVEDQGSGVPAGDLERIFEKFYRAPGTPTGGTGLGLAIAKNIVELHGGAIHAENIEPHGLRIAIEIPLGVPPRMEQDE